jgi:hypothetical protein
MLFMVVESFKNGDPQPAGNRFRQQGRMLPDGLVYHASWIESGGARCFQIMETDDAALLDLWIGRWSDLVDFEVVPVSTSADYWARR